MVDIRDAGRCPRGTSGGGNTNSALSNFSKQVVPGPMSNAQQKDARNGRKIRALYICIDVSISMEGAKLQAANAIVPAIISTCRESALADQRTRFSILTFSDGAQVTVPLTRGTSFPELTFSVEGGTNYTALFRELRRVLEADSQRAAAENLEYFKPTVVVITDGNPNCARSEREVAFADLTAASFQERPTISLFGAGPNVRAGTLGAYTSPPGGPIFSTPAGVTAADSLHRFIELLMTSTVTSVAGGAADRGDESFHWDPDAVRDAGLLSVGAS